MTQQGDEMSAVFGPVLPGDAPALLVLARRFHAEDGHPLSPGAEAALLRAASGCEPMAHVWVVRRIDGADVEGYVVLTIGFSVEYEGRDGFVDDLYLAPQLRGHGVGRRLLSFTLDRARELGIGTLHLEVDGGNDTAQGLYRSAGFEETGRRLMRRRLAP